MAICAIDIKQDIDFESDGIFNAIDETLDMFCESAGIEDKRQIRPQEWTAALQYINAHAIRPAGYTKILEPMLPYNRVNLFAINALLDRYIYLCNLYNQAITIKGFSLLSGISHDSVYKWRDDKTKLYIITDSNHNILDYDTAIKGGVVGDTVTISPNDLYKKIMVSVEQNINDMVLDSKRRGIGAVVRYNRFYETHNQQGLQDNPPAFDITSTAQQLGILDHVQALPGVSGDKIAQRKE